MAGPGGVPYVQCTQLGQYGPAATLNLATVAQQQQACIDATETADSLAFRGRFTLPLLAWGSDVTRYTAYVAWYLLMAGPIGFAPQQGSDDRVRQNYYEAVGYPDRPGSGWFVGVGRTLIQPDITPSLMPGQDPGHDVPLVSSQPRRRWYQFRNGKPVVGGF